MKIGIDARLIEETGVGRYIRNLIAELGTLDQTNEYRIFLREKSFHAFKEPNRRWKKIVADVPWHTLAEQFQMPRLYEKEGLDLVHIPYHNPPIFYRGRTVVTIHDLTILHFSTGKATTLPRPLYVLKRLGYVVGLGVGLIKAKHIIAVSHATKREIIDHFRIRPDKITVTYEGVDHNLTSSIRDQKLDSRRIGDPYFLYVGNAYPHKNVETLINAWKLVLSRLPPKATHKLILVGNEDFFYKRLKAYVRERDLEDRVVFFGAADDEELIRLYKGALAFIFPSRMEGFGLPALEALSLGCTVLASNISVFHEILGDHAVYFEPNDPESIAGAISGCMKKVAPNKESEILQNFLKQYSWKKLAKETLQIYDRVVNFQ